MPRKVAANRLGKFTAKSKRKRTANATKVKYQPPTARNQRKQIMTNVRAIRNLYRVAMPQQVYCDWQYQFQGYAKVSDDGFTRTWFALPLTKFTLWTRCLRQDDNVSESSTTKIHRMSLNLRYFLGNSDYAFFNLWVVTPRKDANELDPVADIQAGSDPQSPNDFIEGPNATNARLNPAQYKVHYASYRTLTENTLGIGQPSAQASGNPMTTFAKGQCNIRCNFQVRNPNRSKPWLSLTESSLPYYRRYYMLVYIVQNAPTGTQTNTGAQFTFDQLATTISSS